MTIHGDNPLRVLLLSNLYPKPYNEMSGIFAHIQVKHLQREGVDIRVVSSIPWAPRILWFNAKWKGYGATPYEAEWDGVKVYYPRRLEMPGSINFSWSGISLFAGAAHVISKIYRTFPFQLIHANTIVPDGFAGLWLSRKYNVPCLCVSRGDLNIYPHYGKYSRLAMCKVLRECDKLITVSKDLGRVAKEMEPGIQRDVAVVYNGCDLEAFTPISGEEMTERRKQLGLPIDRIILFTVGAIEENKGIFELLEMFQALRRKWGDTILLLMIGSGKDDEAFRARMRELDLEPVVHMTGLVPHEQIGQWIQAGDIMVFPTHYEGVPNAVLETLACGKSVVASAVGGIPEIIRHEETGLLVQKQNVEELIRAVDSLIENADLRQRLGIAGREFLAAHVSWTENAKRMKSIYHDLLSDASRLQKVRKAMGNLEMNPIKANG